jgi:iron complex outermembrane receptor protein
LYFFQPYYMKIFTNFLKLIVLFLLLVPAVGFAQLNGTYVLNGKVNDEHGQPLVGTTVSIKGTANTTATDSTGKFSLTTSAKLPFTLVFSAVGFQTQEFQIRNASGPVNIQLTAQNLLIKWWLPHRGGKKNCCGRRLLLKN